MTPHDRPDTINMSGIPVSGVGGLGLVAVAALMTWVFPQAWRLVVCGAIGGTLLGVALIAFRRYRVPSGPSGNDPWILFRTEGATANRDRARSVPPADIAELATL